MSDLIPNPALLPPDAIGIATPVSPQTRAGQSAAVGPGPSFADVLARAGTANAPTFSKHALDRLERRGVTLDSATLDRLTGGIQRAADKGSRSSVVFVDGTAFVTSVQSNTVITAVPPEHMRTQVFTNIDSAVIA